MTRGNDCGREAAQESRIQKRPVNRAWNASRSEAGVDRAIRRSQPLGFKKVSPDPLQVTPDETTGPENLALQPFG